jgi:hypothetical protein
VKKATRLAIVLVASALLAACDSVELTIDVAQSAPGSLEVSNANDADWTDARLLVETVETDNSTTVCFETTVASWSPGEAITIPACGNKIRLTLTTGGETARFAYANGKLFRRFGRKEVPVNP